MIEEAHVAFLLGAPEQTGPVARLLTEEGCVAREFDRFEPFMEQLLRAPPCGVVVWDTLPDPDLEIAIEVVRHHARAWNCAVVLVEAGGARSGVPEGDFHAVIEGSPEPEQICDILKEYVRGGAHPGAGIPRILVVDDDQNIVLLASHIVSGMGMIPLVAFDGPQALDRVQRFHPDLILLDINMPGMDGFEVIQALKADASTSLIPVIVFSARKSDEDKVRALKLGADDYVTKPFSITELSARIDRLLNRIRTGVSASSTTGLPGSVSVEQVLVDRIQRAVPLAVLYLDADHFKAFNDCYGFTRGDSVIRQTADIILDVVRGRGNADDFIGHIGGDDFVVITTPDRAAMVADGIVEKFDRIIPHYYDPRDREQGEIETQDRKGRRTTFPVMSISIAVVTNETRPFHHAGEVADVAAQLKKYAKSLPGSVWVKDKRGEENEAD